MKFTKRILITACAIVGIGLVGAQLSLKTMERHADGTVHIPSLRQLADKKLVHIQSLRALSSQHIINQETSVKDLRKLFNSATVLDVINPALFKKLTSTEALDEFRDKGTIDGEPLDQIVGNDWALGDLKPALAMFTQPWDNNVQILAGNEDAILLQRILVSRIGVVLSVAFNPAGTKIVSASSDSFVRVWTLQPDDTWGKLRKLQGHRGNVHSAVFNFNGTKIVSASRDHTARVWTLQPNGTWGSPQVLHHPGEVLSASFNPDGTQIVTASDDNNVYLWTLQPNDDWRQLQALQGHTGTVLSAAFNPASTRIVTASVDHTVRIWAPQPTGVWEQLQMLRGYNNESVNSAAFNPAGTQIVTASYNNPEDGISYVWTLQPNGLWAQPQTLKGHTMPVYSAAFNHDGTKIITASIDGTARIWQLQAHGEWKQVQILTCDGVRIHTATFNYDDTKIATADAHNERIWTQIDLVGNDNVAAKIMLLQLLNRGSGTVLNNRPHLQKIFATFDTQAKKYLNKKYALNSLANKITSIWGKLTKKSVK